MKRTERTILYAGLTMLGAFNVLLLLGSPGQVALAEAAAWLEQLGPAESLTLIDGDKEMVIRNKAGKLAWGENEFKQAHSVAFVDITKALNPLMESQAFIDERETLRKEIEGLEAEYKTKLDAYGEEIQAMDRQSPQTQEKIAEARRLYQEYLDWGQKSMERRSELDAKHMQQAYRELVSAVNVVSDKLGVDIVLRFIPTENEFQPGDADVAMSEIRLRTALKYPPRLDITTEVLEELSIQSR